MNIVFSSPGYRSCIYTSRNKSAGAEQSRPAVGWKVLRNLPIRCRSPRAGRSVEFSRTDLKADCDSRGEVHSHSNLSGSTRFAMFNAPRPAQPYGSGSTNLNGFGGSFVDENPLASSVYDDGLDPWSAAPSPSPPPIPATQNPNGQSLFKTVICKYLSLRGRVRWRWIKTDFMGHSDLLISWLWLLRLVDDDTVSGLCVESRRSGSSDLSQSVRRGGPNGLGGYDGQRIVSRTSDIFAARRHS